MTFLERKRKILLLVTSLLICIGVGGTFNFLHDVKEVKKVVVENMVTKTWKAYKSKDGGFVVHFPTHPKVEEKILPLPSGSKELSYSEYTSQPQDDVTYSVAFLDMPRKWTVFGTKTVLKHSLNAIVENSPGLEIMTRDFNEMEDGTRVLDYQGMCGEDYVEGRLLLVGTTLFKITAVHPCTHVNESHIQQFMESFNLAFGKGGK